MKTTMRTNQISFNIKHPKLTGLHIMFNKQNGSAQQKLLWIRAFFHQDRQS
jgi:hypothetical protein